MNFEGGMNLELQHQWWATPREGLTLDELIEKMPDVGNVVMEIDRPNNRILLAQGSEVVIELRRP